MKAKVIKTGEIVEVSDYNGSKVTVYRNDETEFFAQNEYRRDELEFLPDTHEEVTMESWVACDKNGDIFLYSDKPTRGREAWAGYYDTVPRDLMPDLTWESEPKRVKITITPMEG